MSSLLAHLDYPALMVGAIAFSPEDFNTISQLFVGLRETNNESKKDYLEK